MIELCGVFLFYVQRETVHGTKQDAAPMRGRLVRSKSDLGIRYTHVEMPEAPGAAAYVTPSGEIDFTVVLSV